MQVIQPLQTKRKTDNDEQFPQKRLLPMKAQEKQTQIPSNGLASENNPQEFVPVLLETVVVDTNLHATQNASPHNDSEINEELDADWACFLEGNGLQVTLFPSYPTYTQSPFWSSSTNEGCSDTNTRDNYDDTSTFDFVSGTDQFDGFYQDN